MSDLRIYVACLASYNNGVLHGAWIDCEGKDGADIQDEVNTMLRASPYPNVTITSPDDGLPCPSAEEWAIHDNEGFAGLIGEYSSLGDVALIADALSGDHAQAFRWLIADRGMNVTDAAEKADEVNIWEDDRGQSDETMLGDYAESFMEETGGLENCPDSLRNYIDFEAMGRDFRLGGDIDLAEVDGQRFIVTNASEF